MSLSAKSLAELAALAGRLADAARPFVRQYFRSGLTVEIKPDHSPVTLADQGIETAIRDILARERPADGFFGEETGQAEGSSGLIWVIDPIDGTKAFICGKPTFGTLIACLDGQRPILGLLDQAVLDERWLGVAGQPTLFNGRPCRTRAVQDLATARLGTTGPTYFAAAEKQAMKRLTARAGINTYGGDCYNYGLLALGTMDLVAEAQLKLYDYAALIPIVEGAGGVITGWDGHPPQDGTILAAATPELHRAALAILQQPL